MRRFYGGAVASLLRRGWKPDQERPLPPAAEWTFEKQRMWCVAILRAVERWDTEVSKGTAEGPMPLPLATSLSRVRHLILGNPPGRDAL